MSLQNSQEWRNARLGRATASRIADIIAKTKTGYSTSRANYAAQLVAERLTGTPHESYINAAMQHGIDTEPMARGAYEFLYDVTVDEVGFIPHPKIAMSGASPDGFIDGEAGYGLIGYGLLEIKCPNTATHIATLLGGSVPGEYITQMQWQMACTGRAWCDFVSFDPRMPVSMSLFVRRVMRDDARIAALETEVIAFLKEVDDTVAKLTERYSDKRAA